MTVKRYSIAFLFAAICILEASSFTLRIKNKNSWSSPGLQSRTSDDCDENESRESSIPQLPAIGSSSLQSSGGGSGSPPTVQEEKRNNDSQTAFVSPKFQLQYTCKVCNTRNCHLVSRIAYREGVVIAICKGCNSKHMIADNLGSGCMDGNANIEEYFKTKGMEDSVNRVSSEVFELEKMLDYDGLIDDDGSPVLE